MALNPPLYPKQWHIYSVDLNPRVGTKPGKRRPCLVIQPNEAGEAGHLSSVILPLTSKVGDKEAYPLRVRIIKGAVTGLTKESDIMIDQVLTWDNSLFRELIGSLPEILQLKVKSALITFLDL